jgi:hypothetical protein
VSRCDADHGSLDLALGSLELLCAATSSRIPKDVMNDAYAAAADGDDTGSQSTTTTRTQKTSTARTATAESTFSTTSSTLSTRATSTEAPPRPITEPSLPSLMLLPTATLAAGSQRTGNSAGGGGSRGSPFDAPSSSNRSRAPGALLVLGALAILCLRV